MSHRPAAGPVPPPDDHPHKSDTPSADEAPGVPGFRTWRGVYVFVFVAFAAMVAALALFTRVYA